MDAAGYAALTRQSGLMREINVIANNIANASTTGFRREGVVFSEFVTPLDSAPSLSVARGNARLIDQSQAGFTQTGAAFDLAIDGAGYFMLRTPTGTALTRAGAFTPNSAGDLVSPDGYPLLDAGGAPLFVPAATAEIAIATDGTVSADGQPVGQIGLWQPADPLALAHRQGTLFAVEGAEPAQDAQIRQGFLEDSNVDPLSEIARMIAVQRAYEQGQSFLEREDDRIRGTVDTLGR